MLRTVPGAGSRNSSSRQEKDMQVIHLLFIAWFAVIGIWLLNHYYYKNVKYEEEYRAGKRPKW